MHCKSLLLLFKAFYLKIKKSKGFVDYVFNKNVYDVIKQRSLFGFEERKKEVNYMDAKVFGKFIMERRKQLGMTQAELGRKDKCNG